MATRLSAIEPIAKSKNWHLRKIVRQNYTRLATNSCRQTPMRHKSDSDECDLSRASRVKRRSRHASVRCDQRSIPPDAIRLICSFGQREYDHRGGIRYLMSREAMKRVYRLLGHTQHIERLSGCYVVVAANDPDFVITVGHRDA